MKTWNRRLFLRACGLSGAALAGLPAWPAPAPKALFRLGLATYSFRSLDVDGVIARCKELGLRAIELSHPQYMLPEMKPGALDGVREKLASGGVEIASYYCGHLSKPAEIERLTQNVARLGVKQVSGSAERELLAGLNAACLKANFRFGIHNHYFEGKKFLYESPDDLLSALSGRSGFFVTLDTGHMIALGFDPTEAYRKLKPHVRIIHLKDEDRPGHNVVLGQGKGNMKQFLETIARERFDGLGAIEFEEGTDPRQEVAGCVRFIRDTVQLPKSA